MRVEKNYCVYTRYTFFMGIVGIGRFFVEIPMVTAVQKYGNRMGIMGIYGYQ